MHLLILVTAKISSLWRFMPPNYSYSSDTVQLHNSHSCQKCHFEMSCSFSPSNWPFYNLSSLCQSMALLIFCYLAWMSGISLSFDNIWSDKQNRTQILNQNFSENSATLLDSQNKLLFSSLSIDVFFSSCNLISLLVLLFSVLLFFFLLVPLLLLSFMRLVF